MKTKRLVFQSTKCLSEDDIRLYLNGNLDESSRYRIENHLIDCPLCSEAVEGYASSLNFDQTEELKEIKNAVDTKIATSQAKSRNLFQSLNKIAAAILLLVVSTAAIFYWSAQKTENDYLAEIQSSTNLSESVRGNDDLSGDEQTMEGVNIFRNGDYQESLFFFENVLESQPENTAARYYAGLSALNIGELNKAIENLTYARFNEETYYEDATWNLILANLRAGNKKEAKDLIADLLKIEGGFYSIKAEKLLKEIE